MGCIPTAVGPGSTQPTCSPAAEAHPAHSSSLGAATAGFPRAKQHRERCRGCCPSQLHQELCHDSSSKACPPCPRPARDEATAQVEPTCFAARLLLKFFFPLFFFFFKFFFFFNTLHIPLGFCDTRTSNDALHNLSITMPRSYCRSPLSPATRREDHFLRAICFSRASSLAVI